MTDIKMFYDNDVQYGDVALLNDDLILDEGLETAVLISLFTNARASLDEITTLGADPQGWVFEEVDDIQFGSKLWLLERSKMTDHNINLAQDYASDALKWMIDDGVATVVDVDVFRSDRTRTNMVVTISKDGQVLLNSLYEDLWAGQFAG